MKILPVVFMSFFTSACLAQPVSSPYTDSMIALLPAAKNDTNKTKLLYRIGNAFSSSDEKKAMYYLSLSLADAKTKHFDKGIGACYNSIGDILVNKGLYDSGMAWYLKGYDIHKKIGYKKGEVTALLDIGNAMQRQGNDLKATDYYLKAIPIAEELSETEMLSRTYIHISNIYFSQQNMIKAKQLTNQALNIALKGNHEDLIAESFDRLASIFLVDKDTLQAKANYNKALEIYTAYDDRIGQASILSNLGQLQNNIYDGIHYKLKAKSIWDSLSPRHPLAINNAGNLGADYFQLSKSFDKQVMSQHPFLPQQKELLLSNASQNLNDAISLAKETGDLDSYSWFLQVRSEMLEEKGDYKSALADVRTGRRIQDSIYSQEVKNKIAGLASEREIARRDKEIALNKLMVSSQRRQQLALVAGIILIAIIGILLFRQSRNRKRTNTTLVHLNSRLEEANKLKAKFFAILSHDLRSPVASLISFLEIQQQAPELMSADEKRKQQDQISAAAGNLLDSMETMLLWSKGQMTQFKPMINAVAVSELFLHLQKQFSLKEGQYRITFHNAGDKIVHTDINYLQTIMYNLTANAVKALASNKDKKIEWTVEQTDNKTILIITDNGPGINENEVLVIRTQAPVANAKTGFGLHIIYDLAEAINCNIDLQTEKGTGTTFRLSLQTVNLS